MTSCKMESSRNISRLHQLNYASVLKILLARRVLLMDDPRTIPLPDRLSHSLDMKRLGNFAQCHKGPQDSKALNVYCCCQSGGEKALKSVDNCTHQTNYPEALSANEISQSPVQH